MAGGKKKTKSKRDKQRAPRGVRSPVKAAARPKNVEGDQELDDKELDDVAGGVEPVDRDPGEASYADERAYVKSEKGKHGDWYYSSKKGSRK